MVAKSYRPPGDGVEEFDLGREYEAVRERLAGVEFETVRPMVFLYLVAALATGDCRKNTILNLPRDVFIKHWGEAVDGIERAIDHLKSAYRVPASRLLPYGSLLVLLGFYFARHPRKPPKAAAARLRDLFFRASLVGRYTGPVETNLTQDLTHVRSILADEQPRYGGEFAVNPTPQFIENHGHFRTSGAFTKAVLCLLCAEGPRSFDDGVPVTIDNDWLKRANSKNYHHFFPRHYLEKRGEHPLWMINHVANITIVDDYLNKAKIRVKPPATYMESFQQENPDLAVTMRTHLIDDLETFGVWTNDYDTFFRKRCAAIAERLSDHLIPAEVDATVAAHSTCSDESDENLD